MARILLILVVVGLMAYALADVWSADEDERGGLPRWLWVLLIVLLPLLGAISWIVVRVTARRNNAGPSGPGRGSSRPTPPSPRSPRPGPRRPAGPVAPDDDPEFLWLLEQEKRKREREARGHQDAKDDDAENNN
ncbi:Phospholipase_D-nuclease N-terminal [Promicromonospora umidemergens]|uniref:Cardiolipin synthase N-terminal domain-containing protein n=1 Tax=Promicromonospora umidemergens TaxID=629679 RepID=A0ABP8X199_9MICO|nr:PLDc N-terminal domain-containing protein [Promicromonospora umidemergens]MCP2286140.1 Phospholipase_D-nuclease N-terminal [Promicromonospora umidemergens]